MGRLYDAAYDDRLWGGIAPALAVAFGAPSAALHLRSSSLDARLLDYTDNLRVTTDRQREEAAHWRRNDPWATRARATSMGRAVLGQELVADSTFERLPYYQDWARRQGQFHFVGGIFPLPDGSFATFGIHRPKSSGSFDRADRARAALFMDHYRRALALRSRWQQAAVGHLAAMQTLEDDSLGLVIVDRDGTPCFANRVAEDILRASDALTLVGGRLKAVTRADSDRLHASIVEAVEMAGLGILERAQRGSLTIGRRNRLPLTVMVEPLRESAEQFPSPNAVVCVRDPEAVKAQTPALSSLFGLTPTEAAIAASLADGQSLGNIAQVFRISINTSRTHLKRILAKTGTSQQSQLVSLVHRSAATLGPVNATGRLA